MNVYISGDTEDVTGITHWDEAEIGKPGYETLRDQMTAEAATALVAFSGWRFFSFQR
ncbi:MAG: M55 family metallopeptidase [Rhodospirillales bacterium]|nr:M55 family metallopeptidase [Rhodospirillales bacterium]